jgi:hypothetical protein
MNNPGGGFQNNVLYGNNIAAPLGTRPKLPSKNGKAQQPPFRMDVPCHTQAVPNLNGPAGAVGPPDPKAVP